MTLIDRNPHAIEQLIKQLQSAAVTVGIHEEQGSAAKKAPKGSKAEGTVAEAGAGAEFGIGQPVRSFIGGWVDEQEEQLRANLSKVCAPVARGKTPVEVALKRFGLWAVGQCQKRIADGIEPELSEERKREKEALTGSPKDTPLIFTGQLRSSIRAKVTGAGGGGGGESDH